MLTYKPQKIKEMGDPPREKEPEGIDDFIAIEETSDATMKQAVAVKVRKNIRPGKVSILIELSGTTSTRKNREKSGWND